LEKRIETKVRWQSIIFVALTLSASLLLGATSLEAAAPSGMPQITKHHVVLEQAPPKKAAEIRKRLNPLKEKEKKRQEERARGKKHRR
jgi:hypothetical protein